MWMIYSFKQKMGFVIGFPIGFPLDMTIWDGVFQGSSPIQVAIFLVEFFHGKKLQVL
jgi:hypothetical protein